MTRPKAVIVDLDGTVALHVLPDERLIRNHYGFRLVLWDLPNQPVWPWKTATVS